MKRYAKPWLVLGVWLIGCAQSAPDETLRIEITGGHSVPVAGTLSLEANTVYGSDGSYSWAIEDDSIASVDAEGQVFGISPGETRVSATGSDTGTVGHHVVVVVDASLGDSGPYIPFFESWSMSAHADVNSPAFNHWNEAGEVPQTCARCHSSEGFIDYLGGDGSTPGQVQKPAPTRSVVRCETCHNLAATELSQVTFPSGVTVDGLGAEARCMTCHQGRASGPQLDALIDASEVSSPDEEHEDFNFLNIHYYPTAATLFAGVAKGGYQYAHETYDARFRHVPGFDSCVGCHDPHSTRVRFEQCTSCHPSASELQGARDIRMIASFNQDYDGDGNTDEGIYYEITTLAERLLEAVQRYGNERSAAICYNGQAFPYWFQDTNSDGECSAEESTFPNRYTAWTARLLQATYNYQMARKDRGAFAHNAKYIIQLLFDSIMDVNAQLVAPLDTSKMVRNDTGHFDGSGRAARNWDQAESVNANCSRCHGGAEGYRFFLQFGVGKVVQETANGLECYTCHETFGNDYDVLSVDSTTFPGNVQRTLLGKDNLCGNCHAGRASKATIDAAIASDGTLAFQNVHGGPAAGVLYGSEAQVGYEYDSKDYAGRISHGDITRCTSCHDPVLSNHTFRITDVWQARCKNCHTDHDSPHDSRYGRTQDFDGDGNTSESLAQEIQGMAQALLQALFDAGGMCYAKGHPYFFQASDQAHCKTGENTFGNRYAAWTPELLQAAHNYQLSQQDAGAWAHNFPYIGQLLYDSIENITGETPAGSDAAMVRPVSPTL